MEAKATLLIPKTTPRLEFIPALPEAWGHPSVANRRRLAGRGGFRARKRSPRRDR